MPGNRTTLVALLIGVLLVTSTCTLGNRVEQGNRISTQPASQHPTPNPASLTGGFTEEGFYLENDPQAQELLRLLDELNSANQAGDPFDDLP